MNNFFLSCKECVLEGPRSFYGCFYLGPFNSSQSLTVANALRRTLLSEISGLGIIEVEIEGVKHEYSNFSGIRESILDLLLNLKEIVFYSNFQSKEKKSFQGYLQVRGPGIVRASDLKLPFGLYCVDPNQYIATLSENGKLNFKFRISKSQSTISEKLEKSNERSRNFFAQNNFDTNESFLANFDKSIYNKILAPSTKLRNQKSSTYFSSNKNSSLFTNNRKILKLDPVFTPIKKVNYSIEPYGTLPIDENNQIIFIELWTNGSIHPRNALYEALRLLNSIFSNLEKMKILNDIYTKSILKSDYNYFKVMKKTSYTLNLERTKKNQLTPKSSFKNQNMKLDLHQHKKWKFKRNTNSNNFLKLNQNLNVSENFETLKMVYFHKKQNKILNDSASIKIFHFPFRIENSLIQANILNLNDLFSKNRNDLMKISGLGNQSINFIEKKIRLVFDFY